MTKMLLFDRDEKLIGTIKNVLSAKHTEEVNGEDTLEVVLPDMVLEKGYKIVYKDKYGYWKEFIIRGIDELHAEEGIEKTVFCESSFYETIGDYIEDVRPQDVAANIALAQALVPTRWEVGQVDDLGLNSTNFYHTDAKTAVQNIAVTWKGELRTRVVVSGNQITHRYVDLLSRRGSDLGKRFTYEKDISEIKKTTVRDDVYTAIYGYGKGEEVGDGYGRRLDFADINGGKAYVENLEALAIWGRNNPDGSKKHVFGKVEFDDCEDKNELLQLTTAKLAELSVPSYIYEAKVYAIGLAHEQVGLGDTAAIIDKEFKPALRLKSRVVKIVEDLLEEENSEITFGNIVSGLIDDEIKNQQAIDNFKSKEGAYDRAGSAFNQDGNLDANFIDGLLDAFNTEANATGGYVFTKQGEGILTIDKPDEATSTMAIQIKGGLIRIANTKLSDGSWNWTTAMDGSGIIADIVNAGVLKGGKVQFDLENGTLLIGNSITDYSLLWDGSKLWLNGKGIDSYATTTYVDTAVPHSIVLSNDNQSIPCDYTGATKSAITVTTAIDTYKGTTRIAATLGTLQLKNASGSLMSLTGVTLSKTNPTSSASGSVTMTIAANTNLSADSGYIEIPITIESKTYTKRLTWNKAKDAYTPVKGVDYFDGQDGQDGSSNYLWIRYSQNSNGNPMTTDPTGALYIGTAVTTTSTAPSSYSSYSWSKLKGDQGIQGETGLDGQTSYLHIKYSNDGGTTFTSNSGEDVGDWIGTYVDFNESDSSTVSDYVWCKVKGAPGIDGQSALAVYLLNENQSIACGSGRTASAAQTITIPFGAFLGSSRIAATVSYGTLPSGVTLSSSTNATTSADGSLVFAVASGANLGGTTAAYDFGTIDITITANGIAVTKKFSWSKAVAGTNGTNGTTARTYFVEPNVSTIIKSESGAYTPTSLTFNAYYKDGTTANKTAQAAYWKIETTTDGNTWTSYATKTDATVSTYTVSSIPANIKGIRATIYSNSTLTTSYDTQSVMIVSDGPTGPQGLQGIQGLKGDQGIQGPTGADGISSYTHIAYANSADGVTGFSVSDSTNKLYIGIYVDSNATDSSDPASYAWTLIKGADGAQGIQGQKGADGLTPYFHTAYATNSTGTTGFSTTDPTGKTYIGTYTDYTSADSTDPTKYTWVLIQGPKGDTGATGATGTSITSVTEYYLATSASTGVTTSTSGWTTTIQTLTSTNKYLWNYEKVNFSNSTSSTTTPIVIGVYGDTGATGSAGKGVSSIVEQYYLSTSATTQSGGSWSSTVPAWVDGNYMWTRSVITYTDNSTTTTSPVCVTGAKGSTGSTGSTGNGISSVDVQYYLSTSSTALSGGTWSTTAPAWVDGKYMWTKTVTTYTNSTTAESNPVCITGAKGSTGSTGAAGVSVSSIVEEYYQSTSSTTQTGGSWSSTVPTWTNGTYIWTRAKTTFSNSTTSTTSPVCVTGQKGTDGITTYTWIKYADDALGNGMSDSPSGKRYLGLAYNKTTATESTITTDYSWSPLYDNVQVGGRNLIIHVNELKDMMVQTDGTFVAFTGSNLMADYISVTAGESLTFSQTTTDGIGDDYFRYAYYANDKTTLISRKATTSTEFTETVPTGAYWLRASYDATNKVKIERGNIATDYSDSPEDIQSAIDAANDAANNAQNAANNAQATADSKADQSSVDDLANTVSQNYSEWQQDSSGLHGQVGNIQTSLDSTNDNVNKVYTYFDFLDTGLNIGKSDSPLQINISNSEMDFLDNGKVVAYVNGQMMYIDSLQVLTSLIVGNHKIEKYNTDITLIKWVG